MAQKRVGVIGWPVKHSLSPVMHNAAFAALGMADEWLYDAMEIPPDIARYGVNEPRKHGYVGINITVPFKQEALQMCQPDEIARAVGAVNTIDFRTNIGTNTDVDGFMDDLAAHEIIVSGQRVLVLGAGGAARAAVYGLRREGAQVAVVNRTRSRAEEMVTQLTFSAGIRDVQVITLDDVKDWQPAVIVNATKAGMTPNVDETPWIHGVPFPEGVTVYDMIYTPSQTKLMQQALAHGGRAVSGLGMLVRQGARAFEIWTGVQPPIDVMMQAAETALKAREA